ncbi:hypothetical protein EEL31_13840 [Brevibacillus laterosporus]|nr:hypothetical protein EEL31_13840 [Brevibacillus laterosporus]
MTLCLFACLFGICKWSAFSAIPFEMEECAFFVDRPTILLHGDIPGQAVNRNTLSNKPIVAYVR